MNELRQQLRGCGVLPPVNRDNDEPQRSTDQRDGTDSKDARDGSKPKRSSPQRKAVADRFAVLNAFVDCSLTELSRAEALTWLVLFRDTRNGTVRTSAADIARRIGVTRRAVTDALAVLRKQGLIRVIYQGGMNRGATVHQVCPLTTLKPGTQQDRHDDDSSLSQ